MIATLLWTNRVLASPRHLSSATRCHCCFMMHVGRPNDPPSCGTPSPHTSQALSASHPTVGDSRKNVKLPSALHAAPTPPNSGRSSQSPHSRDPGARPGEVPTLQRHPRGGQAPTAKLTANRSDSRRSRATPANRHKPCTYAVGRRQTAPDSRGRVRTPQVGFSHQDPGPHRGHRTVDGTGQPRSRSAIVPAQKPWATKTAGRWTGR
jgi:hypothetical protein